MLVSYQDGKIGGSPSPNHLTTWYIHCKYAPDPDKVYKHGLRSGKREDYSIIHLYTVHCCRCSYTYAISSILQLGSCDRLHIFWGGIPKTLRSPHITSGIGPRVHISLENWGSPDPISLVIWGPRVPKTHAHRPNNRSAARSGVRSC